MGIAAYHGTMIPKITANQEDHLGGIIVVPDPRDWYVVPFGFSQDELDDEDMDDNGLPPNKGPLIQEEQQADVPMTVEGTPDQAEPAPSPTNTPGHPIILGFLNKSPLQGRTHLHGRWIPSNSPNGPQEKWAEYFPPLAIDQLPANLS